MGPLVGARGRGVPREVPRAPLLPATTLDGPPLDAGRPPLTHALPPNAHTQAVAVAGVGFFSDAYDLFIIGEGGRGGGSFWEDT